MQSRSKKEGEEVSLLLVHRLWNNSFRKDFKKKEKTYSWRSTWCVTSTVLHPGWTSMKKTKKFSAFVESVLMETAAKQEK